MESSFRSDFAISPPCLVPVQKEHSKGDGCGKLQVEYLNFGWNGLQFAYSRAVLYPAQTKDLPS